MAQLPVTAGRSRATITRDRVRQSRELRLLDTTVELRKRQARPRRPSEHEPRPRGVARKHIAGGTHDGPTGSSRWRRALMSVRAELTLGVDQGNWSALLPRRSGGS